VNNIHVHSIKTGIFKVFTKDICNEKFARFNLHIYSFREQCKQYDLLIYLFKQMLTALSTSRLLEGVKRRSTYAGSDVMLILRYKFTATIDS